MDVTDTEISTDDETTITVGPWSVVIFAEDGEVTLWHEDHEGGEVASGPLFGLHYTALVTSVRALCRGWVTTVQGWAFDRAIEQVAA